MRARIPSWGTPDSQSAAITEAYFTAYAVCKQSFVLKILHIPNVPRQYEACTWPGMRGRRRRGTRAESVVPERRKGIHRMSTLPRRNAQQSPRGTCRFLRFSKANVSRKGCDLHSEFVLFLDRNRSWKNSVRFIRGT